MTMPGMWWATCIRYIIWVDRAGIGHPLAGTATHRSHPKTVPVSTMMLGTPCENAETHACRLCSMSAHSAQYEADFKPWETASGRTRLQRYYPYADLGGWGGHAEVVAWTASLSRKYENLLRGDQSTFCFNRIQPYPVAWCTLSNASRLGSIRPLASCWSSRS